MSENSYISPQSPEAVSRKSLIELLKNEYVTDDLLEWASRQLDKEIALAILMNAKTSQQYLEKMFEIFDTFLIEIYGETKDYYHYIDQYKEYQDAWDILQNIENHINWRCQELTTKWQEDILYEICNLKYPDIYWSRNFVSIINLDCDNLMQNIVDESDYIQLYKKFFWQLRKLRKFPYAKKTVPQINQLEIAQAKNAINNKELNKLLIHQDQDFQIKYAILDNSNLTKEILIKILDNVVQRQDCTQLLLDERFTKVFNKYPHVAKVFLESLFMRQDNKNNQWHIFLAKCSCTPIHILEKLAQFNNNDYGILAKIAQNPKTPEEILLQLVKINHHDINAGLNLNPSLSERVIEQISLIQPVSKLPNQSNNYWYLASAIETSVDDLKKISTTTNDYRILIKVVLNPNTNIEILDILSKNSDYEVRSHVAANYKTPLNILEKLAQDKHEQVRYSVLTNPILTKDIFYKLIQDIGGKSDYSLSRLLAFLDPSVSPEILEKNADSLLWNERFAIAIHPKTSPRTIERLAHDGNIYVRTVASGRANLLKL